MKTYHAHIYFNSYEKETVRELHQRAINLKSGIFKFYKLYPHKVGPHQLPMIELHFNEENKSEVIDWINSNRDDLSVLVHEDSGDDIQDHHSPIWLDEVLPIDFSFFTKVQWDLSLSVH